MAQRLFYWAHTSLCLIVLALGSMLSASASTSSGPIIEQAWFEDVEAEMSIDAARASEQWIVYDGLLSRGYGTGAASTRLGNIKY